MDPTNDSTMPRRKGMSGFGASDSAHSPLSSNFTIRFNKADKVVDSDFVDITQDTDYAPAMVMADKPVPPLSLSRGGEFVSVPHKQNREATSSPDGRRTPSTRSSGPPSPILGSPVTSPTPIADRVASFRDNLHSLKGRFAGHRKNSEDDREKLLIPSAEVLPGAGTNPSSSPGLIGKIVKKIEERRGSHKENATMLRSSSPSGRPERLSGLTGFYTEASTARSPDSREPLLSPTIVRDTSDDVSVRSERVLLDTSIRESNQLLSSPTGARSVAFDTEAEDLPYTKGEAFKKQKSECEPPTGNCPPVGIHQEKEENDPLISLFASVTPILLVGALLVAILVVPMPSFMSGLLFGIILTATASLRIWSTFLFPRKPRKEHSSFSSGPPAIVPGDRAMRYNPGNIPPGDKSADPPCVWMNQMLGDFDIGSFHVNMTQNVYVSLDGTNLRIRKTKNRVLPRRAMYDEELKTNTFSFVESKVFNIYGAEVTLIPKDIPRKRRWLWRFPIGIKLVDPTSVAICLEEIRDAAVKQAEKETKEAKKGDEKAVLSSDKAHTRDSAILYLLPRSDREKEDWYWRLMAATGRNPFPPERPNLSANLSTLNVLVHRICYDVLVEPAWEDVIRRKIQKKLSIIKLPYYIEELQITEMDLGKNIPIISNVSERPDINDRGIWVEMDFEYHGTVHMTLQTKLNLMKLKKGGEDQESGKHIGHENEVEMDSRSMGSVDSLSGYSNSSTHEQRAPEGNDLQANLYESDEADEFDETASTSPEGGKQKLMRYVEKITESKAFQKLTDVKIVRRAMENVSDTDLALTVVVERLAGRLAINIPHPPSDKIWWGFVVKPDLHLKAFPKLGEREVTFNQVTDWIEKKMISEFHRLITVPNMDDLTVSVMNSALDDPEFRLAKLSDLILK